MFSGRRGSPLVDEDMMAGFTLLLLPEGKERCCVSCTTHGLNIRWQDDNDGFKTRNCILEAILGLENDHLSMP